MNMNGPKSLHAAGSTGTGAGTALDLGALDGGSPHDQLIALQFEVEAVGITPTATFQIEGTLDGTNWFAVARYSESSDTVDATAVTVTAVGRTIKFIDIRKRPLLQLRVNVTANTNVTFNAKTWALRNL